MKKTIFTALIALSTMLCAQNNEIKLTSAPIIAPSVIQSDSMAVLECKLPENKLYQKEKDRIYLLIEKQVHHLRGLIKPWNNDSSMKLITESKYWEHYIRPNTTFVADMAFLWRFGDFDEKVVGISRDKMLTNEIVPMLRYLVRTHKTGDLKTSDGRAWGNAWQSAHWTAALGNAAWWTWKALPLEIQNGVRRVVTYEADRIEKSIPPHQIKIDSKSEENSWNSQVLSAALILMPNDSRCEKWELALKKWSLSAYLRPADSTSQTIIDNASVSSQYSGANIYNDFSLENHGIVHPDYMGAWIQNAGNDLDYLLSNRKTSETFLYNLYDIYNLQKRFLLPDGGYCYPSGQDWAIFRNADWMPCHATAVARFNDTEALYHLRNAIETAEKMQARNTDGAIYAKGENYFPSSQPHLGYWMTQSWLILNFAKKEMTETVPQPGVNYLTDGKIILHRNSNAIHTVSWGEQLMIQMMPMMKDHIVSPDQRNGLGKIMIEGIKKNDSIPPLVLKNIDVKASNNGFVVKMTVHHGDYVQSEIICESHADGSLTIHETLTALKPCSTNRIETLVVGILNNPNWVYESGKRNLKIGNQSYEAKSGTGALFAGKATTASVDGLRFKLRNVSEISYITAKEIEASRFTDRLVLNSITTKHQWKQNEVISVNKVTISYKK